ncbi:hypothetical protein NHX12_019166, partial [Muraenolepis orangiensis]
MIPPEENMVQQDESGLKEKEKEKKETGEVVPPSPAISVTPQETKLQRLKRSLSFKTKTIRSKSADNFFRSSGDNKAELLSDVSSSTGHLSTIGMAPPHHTHHALDAAGHCFMEHIFKKPTFCDVCNHMIVGTTAKHVVFLAGNTAKHGLRCKACKMSLHHKCEHGVGKQRCQGKLPKGFRRYYSSPLLIQEQFGCIKEVMPIACGNKVDPVYEALRMGTSLAQKAKRASCSDSPHSHSVGGGHNLSRNHSDDVFTVLENGTVHYQPERKFEGLGIIEDRIGYFPAAYTQQVEAGDQVYRCNKTFIGCKEQGQITLREGQ